MTLGLLDARCMTDKYSSRLLGLLAGTSNMLISNVAFVNSTGWLNGEDEDNAKVYCSDRNPCYNIDYRNISVAFSKGEDPVGARGTCVRRKAGGVHGVEGC